MYSDVLIIGAGPCGLACAARLREPTPSSLFTDAEHARYWNRRSNLNSRKETPQAELNSTRLGHEGRHSPRDLSSSRSFARSDTNNSSSISAASGTSVSQLRSPSPSSSTSNGFSSSTSNSSSPTRNKSTSATQPSPSTTTTNHPSLRILDAHSQDGAFLSRWDELFSSLNITSLRSPLFFHPDPRDRDGMLAYAYEMGRERELSEVEMGSQDGGWVGRDDCEILSKERNRDRQGKGEAMGRKGKVTQEQQEEGMKQADDDDDDDDLDAVEDDEDYDRGRSNDDDGATKQSQEPSPPAPATTKTQTKTREKAKKKKRPPPPPRHLRLDARAHLLDYLTPSTALFRSYCARIAERYHLTNAVQQARVVSIHYGDGDGDGDGDSPQKRKHKLFTITTTHNQTYTARAIIVATGSTALPNVPALPSDHNLVITEESRGHAMHVFAPGGLDMPELLRGKLRRKRWGNGNGNGNGDGDGDVRRAKKKKDEETGGGKEKDNRGSLDKRDTSAIVIVGGGLTSFQLAATLLSPSPSPAISQIHVLLRSRYKLKPFDVDLSWISTSNTTARTRNERMATEFYAADSDTRRAEILRDAKGGGSVSPSFDRRVVRRLVREGRLSVYEGTGIEEGRWDEDRGVWDVVLGSTRATRELLPSGRGAGDSNDAVPAGEVAEATEATEQQQQQGVELEADHVFFATGSQPDITALPFLKDLPPIKVVSGLPVLTGDLAVSEEMPLFFTGALAALRLGPGAALRLGPGAANLAGARMGAERVVRRIEEILGRGCGGRGKEGRKGRRRGNDDGEDASTDHEEVDDNDDDDGYDEGLSRRSDERSAFTGGWANQFSALSLDV